MNWISIKKYGPPPLDSVCWVKGDTGPQAAVYHQGSDGPKWSCHNQTQFSPGNVTHYIVLPTK